MRSSIAASLSLAFALGWQSIASATAHFAPPVTYPTGDRPCSILLADIDGDELLDVLVPNYVSNSISLLRGNGDGTLTPWAPVLTGTNPSAVDAGDLNGDGHLDLVVANYFSNSISWRLGHGDGTFDEPTEFVFGTASYGPYSIDLADVNADGVLDIIAASTTELAASVFKGYGDGTFAPRDVYWLGGYPAAIRCIDVDQDDRLDLVATDASGHSIVILIGDGQGAFGTRMTFDTGIYPSGLAVGDFNHDDIPDFSVANSGDDFPPNPTFSNTASVLLGNGDGTYSSKLDLVTDGLYPTDVAIDDLNRDGHEDLIVANFRHFGTVSVFTGHGDGTFEKSTALPAGTPYRVAIGDLNGDNMPDIVVADYDAASVYVLINLDVVTPTLPDFISAEFEPGLVRLKWSTPQGLDSETWVERSRNGATWERVGQPIADGTSAIVFEDRTVAASERYGYRLAMATEGGIRTIGETWVDVPAALTFRLYGARPNPAAGRFEASFQLATAQPARLDLIDVTGRVLHTAELLAPTVGAQTLAIGDARLEPGMYFLRLAQGASVSLTRVAVVK